MLGVRSKIKSALESPRIITMGKEITRRGLYARRITRDGDWKRRETEKKRSGPALLQPCFT